MADILTFKPKGSTSALGTPDQKPRAQVWVCRNLIDNGYTVCESVEWNALDTGELRCAKCGVITERRHFDPREKP